ncbi:histidine kinase [Streptomyces sp. NPDC096153]|uniref:sensor histidine kinase n=1 Tax=Streptomyces sp. NPDC096153 TaxID=3155548 RepID=UPI00332F9059
MLATVGEWMAVDSGVFSLLSLVRELFLIELAAISVAASVLIRSRVRRRALEESVKGEKFRERHRIARELHDGAGHRLLAITMHARRLSVEATAEPSTAQIIEELAVQAQRDMREALGCLPHPDRVRAGDLLLSDQVIALGSDLPDVELSVHFGNIENEAGLDPATRHAALRIIQEAVSNAIKHGEGPIEVRVRFGEQLELSIANGGRSASRGAHPTGTPLLRLPSTGQGLPNMRMRATELGGVLDYHELPGGGVRIAACLPGRGRRRVRTPAA